MPARFAPKGPQRPAVIVARAAQQLPYGLAVCRSLPSCPIACSTTARCAISQYGAGDVLLWDKGVWTSEDTDPAAALAKGRLHFRLDGEKLRGSWILTRTSRGDERAAWLLIKRHDEEARPGIDITLSNPKA